MILAMQCRAAPKTRMNGTRSLTNENVSALHFWDCNGLRYCVSHCVCGIDVDLSHRHTYEDSAMKRQQPRKLRDRRTGQSPYARYHKRPHTYSPALQQWREHAKKGEVRALIEETQAP